MKKIILILLLTSCYRSDPQSEPLVAIQIQDRNGLTETIGTPERLANYEEVDFLSLQPYKKVLRVYKNKKEGKSRAKVTTYHPNGAIWQYLETEERRAHGAYREWHANGVQKIEAYVIGGTADVAQSAQSDWLFDGVSQVWDDQGNLIAEIPYQRGVLEGISRYFYPAGTKEKEVPFSSGAIHGELIEYFPNLLIRSKTTYQKGVKSGPSLGYFTNSKPAWVEEFREDLLLNGCYYSPEGELLSEVENGWGFQLLFEGDQIVQSMEIQRGAPEGLVKRFFPNRETLGFYHVKNKMKHGEEVEYFSSSEREDEGKEELLRKISIQWNQDAIHGSVKTWYQNGQLQSQREYCRNRLSGPSCAWYRDGSLMFVEEYEENRLIGAQYYKRRHSEPISTIRGGNGTATLYDEEGIFLRKISYKNGKPVEPEEE